MDMEGFINARLFLILFFCSSKDTLEYDEEAEHRCDSDSGPPGGQRSLEGNECFDGTFDQYTEQTSEYVSYTTGQQSTADNG